jgi:hypothetical protein
MRFVYTATFSVAALLLTNQAFAFGSKPLNLAEVKAPSETQIVTAENGSLSVLLRGGVAEVIYEAMNADEAEAKDSDAVKYIGNAELSHYKLQGKQVTCSRIVTKDKKADYACAFDLANTGGVVAGAEPFRPQTFNLASAHTANNFFAKKAAGGRMIASVAAPAAAAQPAKSYVMYGEEADRRAPKEVLVVFKGEAAGQMLDYLNDGKHAELFEKGGVKGLRGKEISCVEATAKEKDRCALVINVAEGTVDTDKNPLFQN